MVRAAATWGLYRSTRAATCNKAEGRGCGTILTAAYTGLLCGDHPLATMPPPMLALCQAYKKSGEVPTLRIGRVQGVIGAGTTMVQDSSMPAHSMRCSLHEFRKVPALSHRTCGAQPEPPGQSSWHLLTNPSDDAGWTDTGWVPGVLDTHST